MNCPFCKKQYARETNLLKHIKSIHPQEQVTAPSPSKAASSPSTVAAPSNASESHPIVNLSAGR